MKLINRLLHRKPISHPSTGFPSPIINPNCTEFEVNSWVISEFIIQDLLPIVGCHPYPLAELDLMVSAVCRLQPQVIFEWGTHIGISARIFYETLKSFQIPAIVHSTDLPPETFHVEAPGERYAMYVRDIPEVNLHRGDGLEVSLRIWESLEKPEALFFLDGDHSYETIKRELEQLIQSTSCSPRGILIHDTLYQSVESRYNIGPNKAIQELWPGFEAQGYRLFSTRLGLPGMTLIYHL